jgi:hypothetical protein
LGKTTGRAAVVDAQAEPAHLSLLELTPDEVGSLGVLRWPGDHQRDLELGLIWVAHGDPAEALAHGDVRARLAPVGSRFSQIARSDPRSTGPVVPPGSNPPRMNR